MEWYYLDKENRQIGPFGDENFRKMAANGDLRPETLVWNETMEDWLPVSTCLPGNTNTARKPPPPPVSQSPDHAVSPTSPSSDNMPQVPSCPVSLKPVSWTWLSNIFLIGLASTTFGLFLVMAHVGWNRGTAFLTSCMLISGISLLLVFAWYHLVTLYRCWMVLPEACRRTSPAAALAFLFIPVFNVYWLFQAYWGFSRDYNRWQGRRIPNGIGEGAILTFCVLFAFSMGLPIIGVLALPMALVSNYLVSKQLVGLVNAHATNTSNCDVRPLKVALAIAFIVTFGIHRVISSWF